MTKLSGFVSGLVFIAACSGGGDPALDAAREAGRDACRRYLDCVLEASPEAVAALLPSYGPDGECWASDEIEVVEICTTACIKAREGYTELFKDVAACGECQDDSHCAEAIGRPRCDPQSHACVECMAKADCGGDSCNTETHVCAECTTNADCDGGACLKSAGQCVECTANADCDGGACLTDTNQCVECIDKADCDGGVCLMSTHQCTDGCLEDADCGSGACNVKAMVCGECKFKVQCPGGACDYATYTCVGCISDTDCADGQTCVNKSCTP